VRKRETYSKSWKKARKTGARAERLAASLLSSGCSDPALLNRLGVTSPLTRVKVVGGKLVRSSVTAGMVPPKADVTAETGARRLGVSVKANKESRLALHTVDNVCAAMETLYEYAPDAAARTSLNLLVGGPQVEAFYSNNARFHPTERRNTMGGFDQRLYQSAELAALLQWLHVGMPFFAEFLFGRGLGEGGEASHVWYFSPTDDLDQICEVSAIVEACRDVPAPVVTSGGNGMGIKLPFGSLETAGGRLVFRHSYSALCALGVPFR
jgi:hypothetical protein